MNTMTNYDSIDKALNTSSAIDVTPNSKPQKVESTTVSYTHLTLPTNREV